MQKEIISTDKAPRALGPYSAAVRMGDIIFTAGQIGIDPESNEMVGDTIEDQTHRALKNLSAVLDAAGSGLDHVVKTTVFLADMGEFQRMNAVYAEYFTDKPPARSAVQAAALPKGARIEIECVAFKAAK